MLIQIDTKKRSIRGIMLLVGEDLIVSEVAEILQELADNLASSGKIYLSKEEEELRVAGEWSGQPQNPVNTLKEAETLVRVWQGEE